ncbi:MAG: hypothetical protein IKC16_07400, partial [Clostridia bacterium]|nr:hypothetical protein [Clostridia bacterium]
MIKTLNGKWNYRIGKGEWTTKVVPFSELCVGHSECQRFFDLDTTSDVVLLKFDGITYNAKVYLNDIHIGKMIPYSEYTFDITKIVKEKNNSLLVELEDIDASFGPSEGWENYGGIIRDVSIHYKKAFHINDVFFAHSLINDYKDAEYSVTVSSPLDKYRVTLSLDEEIIDTYTANEVNIRTIKNIKLWSPESP